MKKTYNAVRFLNMFKESKPSKPTFIKEPKDKKVEDNIHGEAEVQVSKIQNVVAYNISRKRSKNLLVTNDCQNSTNKMSQNFPKYAIE